MMNISAGKNILLIAPPIYDFASFDLWLKPLGLLYIASFLKKAGLNVRLVDALDRYHPSMTALTPKDKQFGTGKYYSEIIPKPDILSKLKIPRNYYRYGMPKDIFEKELLQGPFPDAILITSMMTYWYPGVFETIQTAKHLFQKTPVLLGGIYAKLCTGHAVKNSGADAVITSSDPGSILNTIRHILKIDTSNSIPCPFPSWPSPDLSCYPDLRYAPIMTSMGCPCRCTYCASPHLYPGFFQRDPDEVFKEIASLQENRNITDFAFYDDALLINKEKHFIPLMNKIIGSGRDSRFHTPNGLHTRQIDDALAEIFWQSHFRTLRLSLETADAELQMETGGKVSNLDFKNAVSALHKVGYKPNELRTYVLAGIPGQSLQQIKDTVQFVIDCGARPSICEYSLIPGSADWNRLSKTLNLESLDPLLHNNSIFGSYMGWIKLEEIEDIKRFIRKQMVEPVL